MDIEGGVISEMEFLFSLQSKSMGRGLLPLRRKSRFPPGSLFRSFWV